MQTSAHMPEPTEDDRFHAAHHAANHISLYLRELNGLLIWRAYREYRARGVPVPENILEKFDQWGARLEAVANQRQACEALELNVGTGYVKSGAGTLLNDKERIRAIVSAADQMIQRKRPRITKEEAYRRVAAEFGVTPGAVKKAYQRWFRESDAHNARPAISIFE